MFVFLVQSKSSSVSLSSESIACWRAALHYAQTKAASVAFAKSLAKQLAPRGIRVNAVASGPIWTPLQVSGGLLPHEVPEFGKSSPLGCPGQPVELAPVYVALASAESSYSSGQVFGASGGSGVD